MRSHGLHLEADTRTEHQCQRERRRTRDDLDDQSACVVEHPHLGQPAAGCPYPVRHNGIHRHRPNGHEHHPGRELGAVGDGATDQGGGDDREGQLEGGVQQFGNRSVQGLGADASHPGVRQSAEKSARPAIGERQAVTDQQPCHSDQRYGDEAHHDHVEHAAGAHHAPVEDRQPGRHQQYERRAGQQPSGGGRINVQLCGSLDNRR